MTTLEPTLDADAPAGTELPETSRRHNLAGSLEKFGLPILFIVMIVVFSALLPETFMSGAHWRTVAVSQSVLAVVAMALLFPLVTGRFDISVGANAGLCSIVAAAAMADFGWSALPAIGTAIAVGAIIGVINGILVAHLGINSIIATLGVATVLGGIVQAYTKGIAINAGLSPTLTGLSSQLFVGVPVLFVIMLIIAAAVWFVLDQSVPGRNLSAVGSNEKAAALIGLPVRRTVLGSFVVAGVLAGVAGVLQVASQGNGNPQVGGIGFMLPALAAVFLGATTIRPGSYNLVGTVIGLFFVGTAISGLSLLGVQPWITDVFNGLAVVIAVGVSAVFRRRRTGTAGIGQ